MQAQPVASAAQVGTIHIDKAQVSYPVDGGKRTLTALQGVSLAVPAGQFFSIVGPSGCGKTTLLMAIAGLVDLTGGTVSMDGRPVRGPGLERAVVFQDSGLLPWRSILSNVELGLEAKGTPRAERQEIARHYLQMVGLAHFHHYYPHQLSGGMRQRVGLARALAVNPQVLLMDEPFAALDAQTRDRMGEELLNIWAREKKTVIFITHSLDEAIYLSDRVVVMTHRPGRIRADRMVDLPRPRDEEVRNSNQFAEYRRQIWHELSEEVRQAERAELHQE